MKAFMHENQPDDIMSCADKVIRRTEHHVPGFKTSG